MPLALHFDNAFVITRKRYAFDSLDPICHFFALNAVASGRSSLSSLPSLYSKFIVKPVKFIFKRTFRHISASLDEFVNPRGKRFFSLALVKRIQPAKVAYALEAFEYFVTYALGWRIVKTIAEFALQRNKFVIESVVFRVGKPLDCPTCSIDRRIR